MAAGYMHTGVMVTLIEAGADPTLKDNTGRDVVGLVANLRAGMPLSIEVRGGGALEVVGRSEKSHELNKHIFFWEGVHVDVHSRRNNSQEKTKKTVPYFGIATAH